MEAPRDPHEPAPASRPRPESVATSLQAVGPYLNLGAQIVATMLVWALLGYLADRWLGTTPWLLIVGCVLGMVAVFVLLIRLTRTLDSQSKQARRRSKTPPSG